MSKNEISLDNLPEETKQKIYAVLGRDYLPTKPVTLEQILPELDLDMETKEAIVKILSTKEKEKDKQHERLEKLMNKNRSKPNINQSLETIRQGLDEKRKRRNG